MEANAREVEALDEIIEHFTQARQHAAEGSHALKQLHLLSAVAKLARYVHPAARGGVGILLGGPAASDRMN